MANIKQQSLQALVTLMFKKKLIFNIYLHTITTACFSFFILDTTNAKKSRYSQLLFKKKTNTELIIPKKNLSRKKIITIEKINK